MGKYRGEKKAILDRGLSIHKGLEEGNPASLASWKGSDLAEMQADGGTW